MELMKRFLVPMEHWLQKDCNGVLGDDGADVADVACEANGAVAAHGAFAACEGSAHNR
jgi:hypothetical protein